MGKKSAKQNHLIETHTRQGTNPIPSELLGLLGSCKMALNFYIYLNKFWEWWFPQIGVNIKNIFET